MKSRYLIAAALAAMTLAGSAIAAPDTWLIRFTRQHQLAYEARQAKLAAEASAQQAARATAAGTPAAEAPAPATPATGG